MKVSNMDVYFYQAKCGDAARIHYLGDDDKYHNIFIDSGVRATFGDILMKEIEDIISRGEMIDLWSVSHIHDDHIGGIEKYISAVGSGKIKDVVEMWHYNPPRGNAGASQHIDIGMSTSRSIRQGDLLTDYLRDNGKLPFRDVVVGGERQNFSGLEITVLSPSEIKLDKLRTKYRQDTPLERGEEDSAGPSSRGYGDDDYGIRMEDFDWSSWREDTSVENGSSISFITEYGGRTILWLADSHPSDIAAALVNLGYSQEQKLICDWVKVSHHGGEGNSNDELYGLIECSHYLFSVDGTNRHNLPTKNSIARILRNGHRRKDSFYKIYFTYDNVVLRSIFTVDGDRVFENWNFEVNYLSGSKFLKVCFESS